MVTRKGLPWWLSGKESPCQYGIRPQGWKDLLEKEIATSLFLPGKSHAQRSLAGYSPWLCKRVGHDLMTK